MARRGSSVGSGAAAVALALALALCCATTTTTLVGGVVLETEWTVGDSKGWIFGVAGWEHGKAFSAGDVLVFKYNPKMHNVVAVDKAGYNSCTAGGGARTYSSGDDKISLSAGKAFFICSFPGHCAQGMKIAVAAKYRIHP